jgi:hypothetical protein
MELDNYLNAIEGKDKLYIVTNEKLLCLLNEIYSEIKLCIGAKNFLDQEKINKSVFSEILKGNILPSLNLIERIEQRLKINLMDTVYRDLIYLRGKTNSNRVRVPKTTNKEFVYLFGALRDGSLVQYSSVYEVEFAQKQKEWLENSIIPKLNKVFEVNPRIIERKYKNYVIRKRSVVLFTILNHFTKFAKIKYKPTPKIVLNLPFNLQKYYVAGFYDAEGNKNPKDITFYQQWHNKKECPPLKDIQTMLNKVGIKSYFRIKSQNNAFLYDLHVKGESRKRFLELVPIEHPVLLDRFSSSRL